MTSWFGTQRKDWVVVGTTPSEMKSKGFKQVGKDFQFSSSSNRGIRLSQDRENQVTDIQV